MRLDKLQKILENRLQTINEAIRAANTNGDIERLVELEREAIDTQNSILEIKTAIQAHNNP
jgi:hypothetical protein